MSRGLKLLTFAPPETDPEDSVSRMHRLTADNPRAAKELVRIVNCFVDAHLGPRSDETPATPVSSAIGTKALELAVERPRIAALIERLIDSALWESNEGSAR